MSTYPPVQHIDLGNGLTIAYREAGPSDATTVVFVHGSGPGASGHSNFKLNYPAFADAGLHVLVPDAIGYGGSSKPADAEYTLDFLVEQLRLFLAAKGVEKAVFVGNSLGGAMCVALSLAHPDVTEKLILMAPGGLADRDAFMKMRGIKRMLRCIFDPGGITLASMRKVFELQLYDASLLTEETLAERLAIAQTQPKTVFSTSRVPNLTERLGELQCPIFAAWGMDDQFCPPTGAWEIAQRCQHAQVTTLSECGHWVMVEHRAWFNAQAIAFCKQPHPPMNKPEIDAAAGALVQCLREKSTIAPLTNRYPGITIDNAYHISRGIFARRLQDGETLVGKKIGVTSRAVQDMLDVRQPDFGYLTDAMQTGTEMPISQHLIQPRAEGELAFVLKDELRGPGVTEEDVLNATEKVLACFEIVDSRVENWRIRIQDTIADNASSGLFVLAEEGVGPRATDLRNCQMRVFKNGELLSEGRGTASDIGSPQGCVAWLANTLGEWGIPLKAGEIILSGSLVPLEPVQVGDVMRCEIDGVGAVDVAFV